MMQAARVQQALPGHCAGMKPCKQRQAADMSPNGMTIAEWQLGPQVIAVGLACVQHVLMDAYASWFQLI